MKRREKGEGRRVGRSRGKADGFFRRIFSDERFFPDRFFPSPFPLLPSLLVVLLAACSSKMPPVEDSTPVVTSTSTARKPAVTQKRGGGYYKDDGPGDEIPDNLDEIPDAVPQAEPLHRFANRPYTVLGKTYVPETRLRPFRQRGIASWYGRKFHGQKTSIGETYDMFAMTAAHPTLALPSYVRVTSVSSGKSVIVRVNDRGPFLSNRVIDLSYAAAHRLGYINSGSTQVDVEAILPGEPTGISYTQIKPPTPNEERDEIELLAMRPDAAPAATTAAAPPSGIYLQLGAFSSNDNAESLRAHLARELEWLTESIYVIPGDKLYRVQLGPYASRNDAEKVAERIRQSHGQKPSFVVR